MTEPLSPQPAADAAAGVTPVPAKPAARWEDFIDIFYAPSDVYARRATSGFGLPMLVVTLIGAVIFFATFNAMAPVYDAEFARNAAAAIKRGTPPEAMAKGQAIGEKLMKVMAVVGPPVAMFITGLLLWLFGKLVGARQTLTAAVMVAAFANVPRLLGGIASGVQALLMDPADMTSRHSIMISAARFMDVDTASPVLLSIAGRLELFTIWATVLLAIGLAITGRIPRSRAAIAAALVWLIAGMPELLGALRQ